MLTMPTYESFDEDMGYFGWTENISMFTRQSLEPSLNLKQLGGASIKKRQRNNLLAKDAFRMLNQAMDSDPILMSCRFNSLRSGPFGRTDPFMKSLFATFDFAHEPADADCSMTIELEMHLENIGSDYGDDSSEDFLSDVSPNGLGCVDIPGELSSDMQLEMLENSMVKRVAPTEVFAKCSSLEDVCLQPGFLREVRKLWTKELQGELPFSNTNPIGIHAYQIPEGLCDIEPPIYEFPGKYGEPRRSPKPQKHFVLPPAYTSNSFDYMHI